MDTGDGTNMDVEARAQLQSIIDALSPASRLYVAELPREHIVLMHHGLGTHIRNRFRANELRALLLWSRSQINDEARSLDDLSWPILVAVWAALHPSSEGNRDAWPPVNLEL